MSSIHNIFEEFEKQEIKYIHFKSNCHLDESFNGFGDFDVLVDPKRLSDVETILLKYNGKRFNSFYYGRYPGVDNWLVFDDMTGDIKHFHLHCQIATGKAQVKEYVIPWTEVMLDSRIKDTEWDIYIADPNIELLLLAVRSVVKSKTGDYLKTFLGAYSQHRDLKEEWDKLHEVTEEEKIIKYIDMLFLPGYREKLKRIVMSDKISGRDFRVLSKIIRKQFSDYRRMSGFHASLSSVKQKALIKYFRHRNHRFDACHLIKKTGLTSGTIIAFVGVDGAGKSTVTKEMQKWLQRKMECHRFYMGEGDGKLPLFVAVMKKLRGHAGTNKSDASSVNGNDSLKKLTGLKYIKKMIKAKMILSIEKRNRKYLIRMNKYRINGGISLLDRYPQTESAGNNDGPKLEVLFKGYRVTNSIRRLMERERRCLSIVEEIKPDVIFRLNISAQESMKRKPEQTDIEVFQKKIDELNRLRFQGARIVDINAAQSYESELLDIKRAVFAEL